MSDPAPEPLPAWNATERSRAQTRALLMALSRDRVTYFAFQSWDAVLVALTATIAPLYRFFRRLPRFERLEWRQREEFVAWVMRFVPLRSHTMRLESLSSRWRRVRPLHLVTLALVSALFAAAPILSFRERVRLGSDRWPEAIDLFWRIALVTVGSLWFYRAACLILTQAGLDRWTRHCNVMMAADGRRPILFRGISWWYWPVGVVVGAVGQCQMISNWPLILVPILFAMYLNNAAVDDVRRVHLQLIERLLEWMDDTGLPVEYEVTALNPDEIAAMMR